MRRLTLRHKFRQGVFVRSSSAIWRWYSWLCVESPLRLGDGLRNPEMFSFVMALFLCDGIIVPSLWGKKGSRTLQIYL